MIASNANFAQPFPLTNWTSVLHHSGLANSLRWGVAIPFVGQRRVYSINSSNRLVMFYDTLAYGWSMNEYSSIQCTGAPAVARSPLTGTTYFGCRGPDGYLYTGTVDNIGEPIGVTKFGQETGLITNMAPAIVPTAEGAYFYVVGNNNRIWRGFMGPVKEPLAPFPFSSWPSCIAEPCIQYGVGASAI